MLNRFRAPVKCRARQWHSRARQGRAIMLRTSPVKGFGLLGGECDFTAENFHTISTDTHIDHLVILLVDALGGANKNPARAVHFEPLLDQNPLLAGCNAVRHHPGGAASGGGTGRGIVPVVKNHASMEPSFGIDGFAANEIKEFSAARCKVFGGAHEIKP